LRHILFACSSLWANSFGRETAQKQKRAGDKISGAFPVFS